MLLTDSSLSARFIADTDPCIQHQVIAGQPERSFNHHLSVGRDPAVCDSELAEDWYRFNSPAGNLLPTECPGGNYCGTNIPVWMKGKAGERPTLRLSDCGLLISVLI